MNQTVLTLISLLAIYGLSSFALPQRDADPRDDLLDIQTAEVSDAVNPLSPEDDESRPA